MCVCVCNTRCVFARHPLHPPARSLSICLSLSPSLPLSPSPTFKVRPVEFIGNHRVERKPRRCQILHPRHPLADLVQVEEHPGESEVREDGEATDEISHVKGCADGADEEGDCPERHAGEDEEDGESEDVAWRGGVQADGGVDDGGDDDGGDDAEGYEVKEDGG